jgi:hypothetical protein
MNNSRQYFEGGTWLDPEERAYNTSTGSASGSNRKCCALCVDDRVRTFRVGIPDTYFSIPAIGKVFGKYIKGYVYVDAGTLHFQRNRE